MSVSVQGSASVPALPETGFLRLADVLRFVPVCKTAWYAGVKSGKFPKPIALGARAVATVLRIFAVSLSG